MKANPTAPPKGAIALVEEIGPKEAHKILGENYHNRKIRTNRVKAMAADMRDRRWDFNGETIKIARNGTLIDGQHRLLAVIEAGVTVQFLVVRGLGIEAQDNVDTGTKRAYSDVLQMRGEKNATTLAAMARKVFLWENGDWRSAQMPSTNSQLDAILKKYPDLVDGSQFASNHKYNGMPRSLMGFLWWHLGRIDDDAASDADDFFSRLADGQGLYEGDPVYILRRTLDSMRKERNKSMPRDFYLAAIVIKAWNAYRDGAELHHLKMRLGGSKPEAYPVAR